MSLQSVTGAGGIIVLNGTTYFVKKPTFRGLGQMAEWEQKNANDPYELAAKQIAALERIGLDKKMPELFEKKVDEYLLDADEIVRARAANPSFGGSVSTENLPVCIWICIRPDAPNVKLEEVAEWLNNPKEGDSSLGEILATMTRSFQMLANDIKGGLPMDPTTPAEAPTAPMPARPKGKFPKVFPVPDPVMAAPDANGNASSSDRPSAG